MRELNGDYICDFFAPILSNVTIQNVIDISAYGDNFERGKVFLMFFLADWQ